MVTTTITNRIEELIEKEQLTGVVSVYLFGSMASGAPHEESDVDLGFLLDWTVYPSQRDRFDQRLRIISFLDPLMGRDVDVVILNDIPATFAREIALKGKRILCFEPIADHNWIRDAQLKAADLEPFLERMRKLKLKALSS